MTKTRRVFRRIADAVCIAGILLLVVLWVRSYSVYDLIAFGLDTKNVGILSHNGELRAAVGWPLIDPSKTKPDFTVPWFGSGDRAWIAIHAFPTQGAVAAIKHRRWIALRLGILMGGTSHSIDCPIWILIFGLSIPPLWHMAAYIRHRRSIPKDHVLCPNCGYDLFGCTRATCPECGEGVC